MRVQCERRGSVFGPDYYLKSVHDIDFEALAARGVDTLLIDLDNTLLPRDRSDVPEEFVRWVEELPSHGFQAALVSNNWHEHVKEIAEQLGLPLVAKSVKPLPFAFLAALRGLGSTRRRAAVVGDQMFTDVLGGKFLGMATVLVLPLSSSDLPHTLMLRHVEKLLLAGRQPS